jgi:hypothetical protein
VGRKLQRVELVTAAETRRRELPEPVQVALGELAKRRRRALLVLSSASVSASSSN